MSDDKMVETLRKASAAIYICTDAETAKQISVTFIRAAQRIAELEAWIQKAVDDSIAGVVPANHIERGRILISREAMKCSD